MERKKKMKIKKRTIKKKEKEKNVRKKRGEKKQNLDLSRLNLVVEFGLESVLRTVQ